MMLVETKLVLELLFASSFPECLGLEDLGTTVVVLPVIFQALAPIFLMLQGWSVTVQVPGGTAHVLWNMRIYFLALLIHSCWRNACFSGFLQLFVSAVVFVGLEHRIRRCHAVLGE